ncbi:DUF3014 domain-containing protein [Colwellia sp. MB02u-18]|uniref:DUF3014 domain-containing protein n=1 Tax=unclassified Colwellia TaxID=196834 RepID=UPI0015F70497|nr:MULTISPECIES: DUF3014 domain-containing protein [unclassified Colwellia]MBA6223868.1 DUF3014 domain-containing protein [Colwellia sp. MB3u-45]MBA6267425.1 DUF3014 domain-containing protein [Colwellia sp. MB3u-43]MBA6320049.1 DUF3014 domain-containing protein [Colwellia sp. MB02u-19]MBA6324881.1 DUF3014 domain-containing protein [Colwellia sp. MB02u-18]MBA6330562.1 DUF3014 domain-containing protein [Colwellia sp. MB02u-12]
MSTKNTEQKQTPWAIIAVIIATVIALVIYFYVIAADEDNSSDTVAITAVAPVQTPVLEPEITPELIEPEITTEQVEEEIIELEPEILLPTLDESDTWFSTKLPTLTWRKELLKLVVTEDIIRRFVVFTDNFSQGTLAYEHTPLITPSEKFTALEEPTDNGIKLQWDESSTRRFSNYVDLLRSMDSETLVQWYVELKPLIDQAYGELGYPEQDFTEVLHNAITKVLDMEIPKTQPELERLSVMYKYKDSSLESLDDAEKLLLRLGKENLLVIKSVLLEINEKLARSR